MPDEEVTHFKCPANVEKALRLAGGLNRFGEPMFRCVWGFDRIVPSTGEWQEFEEYWATLTDRKTGYTQRRKIIRLKRSVIETRMVPKYKPYNSWHLEMWRPPEEYGTPESWGKAGEEIVGLQTIDTAGPFPSEGEYELCYPLTTDGSCQGEPIPLIADVVAELVGMIRKGPEWFSWAQRKAALEQEAAKKDLGFVRVAQDKMLDALKPFCGETFVTVPEAQS